jgi:hypothetical protein
MNNSSRELAACNGADPADFCRDAEYLNEKWEVTYYLDMYLGET